MSLRFSVIMPLYNKAQYVCKAMESVIGQSYADWELVVVDDCSTDGSAENVAEFTDPRIRLVRLERNCGVSVARNTGVSASYGDYLCFLDADDWWASTFLEEMAQLIAKFPDAGIYGTNYTIVNEMKNKTRVAQIGVTNGFEKGYINYCQVYAKTMYMPLWTGAVCIPRKVFGKTDGFPKGIKLGEDFLLWIRIALKYKVAFLNKPLAYYNQDVDVSHRGVGHLHQPQRHMLWNMDFLSEEEKTNPDFKLLIDNLRVYGLFPYYLSKEYHEDALKELGKVDWTNRDNSERRMYSTPLCWLKLKRFLLTIGSKIKTKILWSLTLLSK